MLLPVCLVVGAGNLCFHTAVMQCLLNTSGLPNVLWASFPEVPEPPKFAQPEPLANYTVPVPNAAARPTEPCCSPATTIKANGDAAKPNGDAAKCSRTSSDVGSRRSLADSTASASARDVSLSYIHEALHLGKLHRHPS